MHTLQIRQMIGNALIHDGYTGSLAQALAERSLFHGQYADPNDPMCFHVMPFSEDWSDAVRNIAARTCNGRMRYVRGDEVQDERIVRSIWDSICTASHVLVDITGMNDNVMLELGIAHVLGRNTLIVAQQEENFEKLFPSIARRRVQAYSLDDGARAMTASLDQFLDLTA